MFITDDEKHYANTFSSDNFHSKENLLKIFQFYLTSETSLKDPKMTRNCYFSHFLHFHLNLKDCR